MGYKGYRPPTERIPVGIGQRIDDWCFENDVNFSELAIRSGIDRKVIYSLMETGNCRLSTLVKIANAMNVSLDWLVYGAKK